MESNEFVSRRKFPRHNLRDSVRVVDKLSGQPVGTVANLSLEGLMLVSNEPLRADHIYQLSLIVAENVISENDNSVHELNLGVDCLWSSPAQSTSASAYWSGCQIIDISETDFELIKKLISSVSK